MVTEEPAGRRGFPGIDRRHSRLWSYGLLTVAGAYSAGLAFRQDEDFSPLVDGFLDLLTVWLPAAVGWLIVHRTKRRRPEIFLAAAALTCQAAGETYYVYKSAAGEDVPLPSPADVGYTGFYVFMLATLAVVIRRRLPDMTWPVVLDSAVGALGASAILGILLEPILNSVLDGPRSLAMALGAAYPLLDLLLVAAVIGIAASTGRSIGRGWGLLVMGLLTFTGADVGYALLELNRVYVVGTTLDAFWALGIALIGIWVVMQGRNDDAPGNKKLRVPSQAVPALATVASLVVLILGTQVRVALLAVFLASLTLSLAALPLVFRQRIRLADLQRQARTDELTGLPNRRALYADVPSRLASNGRRRSAVLLLDLDKFKEINDSLGHDVGDTLLTQVAARLSGQLRPADLLARMGGDEFVMHVDNCGTEEAQAVALKLRAALAEPYDLGSVTVHVNASIGISCYPDQGQDLAMLLRRADMAMYTAKSTHSGHFVYDGGEAISGPNPSHTVQVLNEALSQDQLLLHFQPKIDLDTGHVRGVEALVRWQHPDLGLLQPDDFLKRFEEAGLMPGLTGIVLGKALDQAAAWSAEGRPLTVAVNLSAPSIIDSGLPDQIDAMTSERGLSPSVLVLEITEDVLVADRDRAYRVLSALRDMGVRIAVDDFGKGYSSLSYLRELPIDELKLDKSFILSMTDDSRATALVVSTIDLAHSLGLDMTAEGVEDADAYRALSDYGCDVAQGFFMSKPVPAAELDAWLADRRQQPQAGPFSILCPDPAAESARPRP
ncbi:EAL domain-containing protein [Arthrobacter sp. UYCu712]|uniref:putative bifunctional diguanylate cyclase/phosphodiesterase n=1 Tax=Arthrobacter sp. UYCu712 TaxID=3156340 RepID=UPI0033948261